MSTKGRKLSAMLSRSRVAEETSTDERFRKAAAVLAEKPDGLANPSVHLSPTIPSRLHSPNDLSAGSAICAAEELLRIPLDNLIDNPYNARKVYVPERIKELAESIAANGQEQPGIATPSPADPHAYILVAGHRRKRALELAGQSHMLVRVLRFDRPIDMYQASYRENNEREDQTPLDNALAWKQLLEDDIVKNETQVAEMVGMSLPNVNKTLALLELPRGVLDFIQQYPDQFGISVGYELTQLSKSADPSTVLDLAQRVVGEGLSKRDVEAVRKNLSNKLPKRRREISRQYRIKFEGQQIGYVKEWDSGRVQLDIKLSDKTLQSSLVDDLKQRFNIDQIQSG